jgi:aminopeptidase N
VAKIIRTFSEDIGMYAYPKMVAADAADGMEYPMLTLDGGRDPGYHGLLVHEIGHNWFYGMVGSNETYRAAMDEGFTQFLTAWGLRRIDGDPVPGKKPKGFFRRGAEGMPILDRNVLYAYTVDALNRDEVPLNTHSDDFHNALGHEGGYRQVYYKTASMLYNLQYTLGDSLFQGAMKHYFSQWKIAHPYFEDFRNSIIQFTHVDLNWFFDQWFETTKTIDYSVTGIRKLRGTDSFSIGFRRRGESQMPLDFTVLKKDGTTQSYVIPNTWFAKKTPATVLPKWLGWGQLHERYTARVAAPEGIREVRIDTSFRLADAAWLDNARRPGLGISSAVRTRLDRGIIVSPDRRHYRLWLRPDLWWNPIDGIKAGLHAEGSYLSLLHNFDATVWFNTHLLQREEYVPFRSEGYYERYAPVNYTFNYRSPLTRSYPKLQIDLHSRFLDGLQRHSAGLFWNANSKNTLSANVLTMWRPLRYDLDYLIYPNEWSSRKSRPNSSVNLAWTHNVGYRRGTGAYTVSLRAPFLAGNGTDAFNYGYGQVEAINYNRLGKLEVRTRAFGRYGAGGNIPAESALWLSGANPEALMENKYTRTQGFIPNDWRTFSATETNHFQQGGGLNLRGYAGFLARDQRNGEVLLAYKGRSGASANVEIDLDGYLPFRPKATRNWLHADLYLFADAGIIELSRYSSSAAYWQATPTNSWSAVRADAGAGTAVTIKRWGKFEKAAPLTLRFDVPFIVSHVSEGESNVEFRYVIGVGRSF